MFLLSVLEDKLKINPHEFDADPADVLLRRINAKYVNKVIPDVGLCVAFYDLLEIGDPFVYPGEGASHQHAKFRVVIFRPFVGEVMVGRVIGCSCEGVRVSLEFFDDVYVPSYSLQAPSEYSDRKWLWNYAEGQEAFPMEVGDTIRLKVVAINFSQVVTTARGVKATTTTTVEQGRPAGVGSVQPLGAKDTAAASALFPDENPSLLRRRSRSVDLSMNDESPPAMKVIGCANEDGFGLVSWWVE